MSKAFGITWLQNIHAIAAIVDIACGTERGIAANPIAYSGGAKYNDGYPVTLF